MRVDDARAAVATMRDASFDLVIGDVFAGARTPAHLTSVEFAAEVARVLAPGGRLPGQRLRRPAAALRPRAGRRRGAVLPHACLIADAGVLRGRRHGNLVLVAGRTSRRWRSWPGGRPGTGSPGGCCTATGSNLLVGRARPVTDATAELSPAPPDWAFGIGG